MASAILKNPIENAEVIGKLEDEIIAERDEIKELTKDDAALHRELAREKALGEDTEHYDGIDNNVHAKLYNRGNLLTDLRDKKHHLEAETDAEFDIFQESFIEKELEQGRD